MFESAEVPGAENARRNQCPKCGADAPLQHAVEHRVRINEQKAISLGYSLLYLCEACEVSFRRRDGRRWGVVIAASLLGVGLAVLVGLAAVVAFTEPEDPYLTAAPALSAAQRHELAALRVTVEDLAERRTLEWRTAILAARDGLAPRPDLGECAFHVSPELGAVDRILAEAEVVGPRHGPPLEQFQSTEIATSASPQSASNLRRLAGFTDGTGDAAARLAGARMLAQPESWAWDVTVVTEVRRGPGEVDEAEGTFRGGVAIGRAYVFDYASGRIACVGEFRAESSESVSRQEEGAGRHLVEADFEGQLAREALASLSAAGPPL